MEPLLQSRSASVVPSIASLSEGATAFFSARHAEVASSRNARRQDLSAVSFSRAPFPPIGQASIEHTLRSGKTAHSQAMSALASTGEAMGFGSFMQ